MSNIEIVILSEAGAFAKRVPLRSRRIPALPPDPELSAMPSKLAQRALSPGTPATLTLGNLCPPGMVTYTCDGRSNPMIQATQRPPEWAKIVLRTVGTVNAAAVLLGTSFLMDSVYRVLTGHITEPPDAPYFRPAFAVMALIELAFVSVLLVTAIRFMQLRLSAVHLYSLTVLLLLVYNAVIQMLWHGSREIASSIAAATAGSSANAVFEFLFLVPFLYPVVSVVLVQLLKRRYGSGQTPVGA